MPRLILTFETTFQVMSADQMLRDKFQIRPTPTPPGLSQSICGVSLEILNHSDRAAILEKLAGRGLIPSGVHEV
ncbi:MAG: putative Se/S carrier-like protein [Candidatus Obscuribacterales bacterium]